MRRALRHLQSLAKRQLPRLRTPQQHAFPSKTRAPAAPRCLALAALPIVTATPLPEPPSALVIITIIVGLPAALWAYKGLIMMLFQRKIMYMGYLPMGSRQEELDTHVPAFFRSQLHCEEVRIDGEPGVTLYGILVRPTEERNDPPDTVILYLQGNAGNPLQRMNIFYTLLRGASYGDILPLARKTAVLAVAPRSYWKSTNCGATQRGILADHRRALHHALARFPSARIVVYGHSLGGAAALCLLAGLTDVPPDVSGSGVHGASVVCAGGARGGEESRYDERYRNIVGLVLENPLASTEGIVRALYPQPWLPYHYLGHLALDKWDALAAVRSAVGAAKVGCEGRSEGRSGDGEGAERADRARAEARERPPVLTRLLRDALFLVSERDEVVPPTMGMQLCEAARGTRQSLSAEGEGRVGGAGAGAGVGEGQKEWERERERGLKGPRLAIVPSALHDNAWNRSVWLVEMRKYFAKFRDAGR